MTANLYLRDLCNQLHQLNINEPTINNIQSIVHQKCSIPIHHQQLWHNGKLIHSNVPLDIDCDISYHEISISLSLCGGKGGFGSMLRAAGKLNKTTNKSAMRDLSGRRYRFVEQEKELTEWLKEEKTSKRMTVSEIHNDFRHIKEYGTLPEKRMCHRGINCRYRDKCRFVHPDDMDNDETRQKQDKKRDLNIYTQSDEEMRNALLMGQINAKEMNKKRMKNKQQTLFEEDNDIIMDINDILKDNSISHQSHKHKLKLIIRDDCDFIICDLCCKQYVGASWHCCKSCDYDLCDDCVVIDGSMVSKDIHLTEYHNKSDKMKEIEQKDQRIMNIGEFSRGVDRKRKRKERKLGLLGLDNVLDNKKCIDNTVKRDNKCIDLQRLKGEINGLNTKDPNQIVIDFDLLFPIDLMNWNKNEIDNKKGDINLIKIKNIKELKVYGMDKLKEELKIYGLKCGGTLQERAERLFLLKDSKLADLPKNVFASKKKKFKRPPRKKQRVSVCQND